MRGQWFFLAGTALFLGIGFGAWSLWRREHKPPPPPPSATQELPSGAEVVLSGKIQAVKTVAIDAPIGGVLEEFPVKPGDEVAEGQVLGRIANDALADGEREAQSEFEKAQSKVSSLDSAIIAARLESSRADAEISRARSDLARAEKAYQRQSMLHREGATPRKQYEAAAEAYEQLKIETATLEETGARIQERLQQLNKDLDLAKKILADKEAYLESAKQDLKASELRAPVDGVIVAIARQAGDPVEQGSPALITICTDLSLLEIALDPDPPVLKRIQPGAAALIQMDEIPGAGLVAAVREIKNNRPIVEFGSPSTLIRPGMTATVRIKLP